MNSQKLSLLFKYFLVLISLVSCAHNENEIDEKLVNQNVFLIILILKQWLHMMIKIIWQK